MKVTYHKAYSDSLQRDMEYKTYGHQGKPVLVFPTSCGRFYQYEDSGMIGTLESYIEQGQIQVWTCDSIDEETFYAKHSSTDEKMKRYDQYDAYVKNELIPSILHQSKESNGGQTLKILATGCSLGAYHSANMFFRHPQYFDSLIALSGLYSTNRFFGEEVPPSAYYHSPLHYLKNLEDDSYLNQYRNSQIIICTGQGAYEDLMRSETQKLLEVLQEKHVPASVEFWGYDVNHDWYWWRKQILYYMNWCLS
ncbi:esterase family protein [Paenibacillus sp. MAH-36]|uniref:Alpha/beta hydrolase-fold protein n=2 Tax=Paenibacillus TaxID=44249 RepID=A0ABU3RCM6_9BACL|nr:alpha/beta hydrolase-fold protein [Paenibacillus sp. PFR10]MDU0202052.1 alpha/beta hydrolase-fold protein [Paenibacillus sp. PFR10]